MTVNFWPVPHDGRIRTEDDMRTADGIGHIRTLPPVPTTVFLAMLLLTSCAAAPLLVPAGVEFARNLFTTSVQNYGSKYCDSLTTLVGRLASPYTQGLAPMAMGGPGMAGQPGTPGQPGFQGQPGFPGQPGFQGQQVIAQQPCTGQQMPPGQVGAYDPNNPYGSAATTYPGAAVYPGSTTSPYGTAPGYPSQPGMTPYDPNNPYGAALTNPYGQQVNPYGAAGSYPPGQPNPYGTQNPYASTPQFGSQTPMGTNPYGMQNPYGTTNPYGGTSMYQTQPGYNPNNPYGTSGMVQGYGQAQPGYGISPPYGAQQQPYGGAGMPNPTYGGQPYGAAGIYPRSVDAEPIGVDVAMIRQKQTAKGKEVVLMNDGEILKDGGANKEAGDRFKIVVRANCDCHLYIMSIDGSGWAEAVFPGKGTKTSNPVKKDQEYAFPEEAYWFTLDQVKGIETFYVVVSANRRTDLEESFSQIATEKRPATSIVAKVEKAPVIPRGFGSVQPRGIVAVKDETGTAVQVTPLSYTANRPGQDVTVTRWFKHE